MMRKLIYFSAIITLLMTFSAENAQAQNEEGNITIGGGLGYGFDLEYLGINLNGYYSITPEIRAGLDILYYLDDLDGVSFWELNILGNYLFIDEDGLEVYALAGIHRFNVSFSNSGFGGFSTSQTGLIIGGGVAYDLGGISVYGEPKISLVSAWGQFSLSAGVRYTF